MECECRKPKPGLIEKACYDFRIDRNKSFLIGDAIRDIECAKAARIHGVQFYGHDLCLLVQNEAAVVLEN